MSRVSRLLLDEVVDEDSSPKRRPRIEEEDRSSLIQAVDCDLVIKQSIEIDHSIAGQEFDALSIHKWFIRHCDQVVADGHCRWGLEEAEQEELIGDTRDHIAVHHDRIAEDVDVRIRAGCKVHGDIGLSISRVSADLVERPGTGGSHGSGAFDVSHFNVGGTERVHQKAGIAAAISNHRITQD